MGLAIRRQVHRCHLDILGGQWDMSYTGHNMQSTTNSLHSYLQPSNPFSYIYIYIYQHASFSPLGPQLHLHLQHPPYQVSMTTTTAMFSSVRASKLRPWGRCSKYIRQQRTRLYIIWRCTVLLLCWHE